MADPDWWDQLPEEDRPTSGGSGSGSGGDLPPEAPGTVDIPTLPYRFNPPPHPSILHVVPDLSRTSDADRTTAYNRIYNEPGNTYGPDAITGPGGFRSLRLGRIIQWEKVFSYANQADGERYGFRFLYNPTTVTGGPTVGRDFIPDPSSTLGGMLQSGLETITVELLINRSPEVQGSARVSDYKVPTMSQDDLDELKVRGTAYDVEFLYRVANGRHNTSFRGQTGDIGVLLPNPCEMFLGPYRTRGGLFSISVTDQMYSADMVPMISYVNIVFMRYLSFTPDEELMRTLASTGVVVEGKTKDTSDSGSGSAGSDAPGSVPGGTSALDPKIVEKIALDAGFTPPEAKIATQIAWGESRWFPVRHNGTPPDNSYGLWQINMYGDLGPSRRKQLGIPNNEALFDPTTNARAARMIYKSQGWRAWSVYTQPNSPSYYKKAPSW